MDVLVFGSTFINKTHHYDLRSKPSTRRGGGGGEAEYEEEQKTCLASGILSGVETAWFLPCPRFSRILFLPSMLCGEEEEEEAEETERIRGKSILFSPPPPRSISYEKLFVPTSQISRGGSLVRALKKYYRSVSIGAGQSITGMILGS